MITEKENYLICLNGGVPEWVPEYTLIPNLDSKHYPPCAIVGPRLLGDFRMKNGGKDVWGVNWVPTESTSGALIPEPNNFILDIDDMEHWHDFIKVPDISGVDWEGDAKRDLDMMKIDRKNTALSFNLHVGYFQQLVAFMGFENGLMAMYECPDEVEEIMNCLCDFYCEIAEKCIDYYKPDILCLMDDTAAWGAPFFSPEMYRKFLIPVFDRQAKFGRDRGLPISMHNCGKAECFLDDLVGIGVTMWDPAQTCNDLDAVKQKYGNKLVIAGGWDARDHLLSDDVTDEEIYESVKQSIERLAPGGGYCFCGGFLGAAGQEKETNRKNAVVHRALEEIGRNFYKHN
jgi:hypothetical protein